MPVEQPHLTLVLPRPSGTGKQKLELQRSGSEQGFRMSSWKYGRMGRGGEGGDGGKVDIFTDF